MANCTVSGTFTNPQGSAVSGATVRFNTQKPYLDGSGNLIMPKEITTTTATNGTWSLSIAQGIAGNLTLDLNPTLNAPVIKYSFSLIIPTQSTSTFASCWVDSASFGGQVVSSSILFSQISGQLGITQMPALTNGDIWVGNVSTQATPVAMSGDVTMANTGATTVGSVGGSTSSLLHAAELLANGAVSTNTPSTLVKRDSGGNFSAGTVTANLTGNVVGTVTGSASLNLLASNNLSDVISPSVARSSLGLGSAATASLATLLSVNNNLTDVASPSTALANLAAAGASGNVLTSNGTTWASQAPVSSPAAVAVALITAYYSFS